jgi:hypothetical protein
MNQALNSNSVKHKFNYSRKPNLSSKFFMEHESYHDPILSEIRALRAAARAEGDEQGEDEHDH